AAAGGAAPSPGTALADLWREIDESEPPLGAWDLDLDDMAESDGGELESKSPVERLPARLTPFLENRLQRRPLDAEQRARCMKAAWDVTQGRVRAILEQKRRRAYERAAELVVGVAEARLMAGEAARGQAFLEDVRRQHSRYSAFTRELDKIARRSPLLKSWSAGAARR
ncbi:MAG: hypothetical protein ACE147_21850, partial [Candidatus Methylomirabilales bacterium]